MQEGGFIPVGGFLQIGILFRARLVELIASDGKQLVVAAFDDQGLLVLAGNLDRGGRWLDFKQRIHVRKHFRGALVDGVQQILE